MAEGQSGDDLLQSGTLKRRNEEGFEAQLSREAGDEHVKRIRTSGNNQVGGGNTQVITGSTTHNTYITNINIENYHQNGNEPFSLHKSFQLKADNQLCTMTSTTQASTQTQASTKTRGSSEEGPSSCQTVSNSNGIECPKCGHVLPTNESMSPNAEHLLETSASSDNNTAGSVHVEMDSVSVTAQRTHVSTSYLGQSGEFDLESLWQNLRVTRPYQHGHGTQQC